MKNNDNEELAIKLLEMFRQEKIKNIELNEKIEKLEELNKILFKEIIELKHIVGEFKND